MAQTAPPIPEGRALEPRTTRGRRPGRGSAARRPRRLLTAPPLWRELLLIALFYSVYTLIRLVLNRGGSGLAYEHADQILGAERFLGIDVELGLNKALLGLPWLAKAANYFYATAHFAVTLGILIWLYRRRPQHYRWLRAALIGATVLALLGYWLYPLAPPRFLPWEGFVDPVTALHSLGLYSSQASGALTNQFAAMPSMHFGWALWCGFILVMLTRQRWTKVLGVAYPAITLLVILATANHYILDAVVGAALIVAALTAAWLLYRGRLLPAREPAAGGGRRMAAAESPGVDSAEEARV